MISFSRGSLPQLEPVRASWVLLLPAAEVAYRVVQPADWLTPRGEAYQVKLAAVVFVRGAEIERAQSPVSGCRKKQAIPL